MSNPVPETTAPRPCRHESSVSNKIQQHANKKAKKIDHVRFLSANISNLRFCLTFHFRAHGLQWIQRPGLQKISIGLQKSIYRAANPLGKSFSAIIAIKKPDPIMFHKRQFRVQHAIESFCPIPFRRMFLLHDAHQHQIIMQSCRGIINPVPGIFICLMKAKKTDIQQEQSWLPAATRQQLFCDFSSSKPFLNT